MDVTIVAVVLLWLLWTILWSVLCFKCTRRFDTGFALSLGVQATWLLALFISQGASVIMLIQAAVILVCSVVPIVIAGGLVRLARKYRHEPDESRCAACGYNLTGNVSGICSECGRPVDSE